MATRSVAAARALGAMGPKNPRGFNVIFDTNNMDTCFVRRRWLTAGADLNVTWSPNALCVKGAAGILSEALLPYRGAYAAAGTASVTAAILAGSFSFGLGAVIVTASTNVLNAGKIRFAPNLPKRHLDAAGKLGLGSHDHVALELTGNPLGLRADELVFEKCDSNRTAAILANMAGSTLCVIDVAGSFGRDLAAKGQAAMIDFAITWLGALYGADVKDAVKRRHATRWNAEPWALGASSVAAPGAQSARRVMMEPVGGRIFFAGEAAHETLWGTVGGAWESGERAGDAVVRLLGGRRP